MFSIMISRENNYAILFKMIRLANKLLIFLSMLLKPNRVI